ncbi:uncharacterized protein ACA1_167120 [Acanthamoeba castellanii str. Neff]|uniref:Uncharacterized protein n=1 Tax=Acanthamoeba castellanii (strain ATCC 30010 / Neff) TaxID=1257118 RepID=L8H0U9_ACACF|nr:uncharacterized protein ACA1_167120 [Acanthamoeba castellanii str. Neff]ELR18852.1 hypothetical protein ACA1_167120 [Acanthamoeba castellanii str. Neff]
MQTANKGKAIKEIERLRRFLHTNQNFRFTEADKNNLYSAIEAYRSMFSSPSSWQGASFEVFSLHLQCTEAYGGGVLQGWGHQVLRFPSSRTH